MIMYNMYVFINVFINITTEYTNFYKDIVLIHEISNIVTYCGVSPLYK